MNNELYSDVGQKAIKTGSKLADIYDNMIKSTAKEYGFTNCEAAVLYYLHISGKAHTIQHISSSTHYTKGMISRSVSSLAQRGYVIVNKDSYDSRSIRVSLTDKELDMPAVIDRRKKELLNDICCGITDNELRQLDYLLTVISRNIQKNY